MNRPLIGICALTLNLLVVPTHAAPSDLDPTFGDGGKVTTDFGAGDSAQAVAIQPDGKISKNGDISREILYVR